MIEDVRTSAYTSGLGWFGLRELEVRRSSLSPPDLLGTLADVAEYQISTARVLADGDTVGATADDRTRVRLLPSEFMPDTEVAVLEMRKPARSACRPP